MKKLPVILLMMLAVMMFLAACGGDKPADVVDTADEADAPAVTEVPAESEPVDAPEAGEADLAAVKAYAVDHAAQMKAGTEAFRAGAEEYYAAIAAIKHETPDGNPYEILWETQPDETVVLIEKMREDWFTASQHYELNEGIIAGVPTLAYFDGWIDAGPTGADAPDEAIEWQLILADGTILESPGNFFHNLTEPALYGTIDEYVGLAVDMDGDGSIELGEVLPEAEILLASAQGMDEATAMMVTAVNNWEPTLEDAFMAEVTMIPTMNEYFEQWKLSSYIAGNDFQEVGFIAVSRLFDINGILGGLDVTYDKIRPVVANVDADLDTQIAAGFEDLVGYVGDLYAQELEGVTFTPEEADAFGTEAQDKATALAALVAQAADKAGIALDEEPEGWEPDSPPVMKAVAPAPAKLTGGEMSDSGMAGEADLAAVKAYAVDHAAQMKAGTEAFRAGAEEYYTLIAAIKQETPDGNPYEILWETQPNETAVLIEKMREDWFTASQHYELNEGIIAGVPTLAYFDGWIDAGPTGADAPDEAIEWQLILADGTVLESPGNFFHNLTEPALYGTIDEYVGLAVDMDGDGSIELGEVLPEAEILLASAQGMDEATAMMVTAVANWEPTLEDAFMAEVTMIPTMNEYFEQWKLSSYIAGNDFQEVGFIAVSRLFDINGILGGLDVTYDKIRPVVANVDADLDTQIAAGFEDLVGYVGDLYAQELEGVTFTPEEADAFGTEAQDKATALAALVAQAADKAGIDLAVEMEGWEPDSPPVMQAVAPAGVNGDDAMNTTPSKPVTLKLGAKCGPSPHVMPFLLMMAQTDGNLGENVTIEYVPVTEPSQMAALLNTQEVDVMVGFIVQTANIFQKGEISNLRLVNVPLWQGFYVVGGEDITEWEDLTGEIIAMPNPQSGPSQLGTTSMKQAGFNPESDFEVQNMPASQIVQMLISNSAKAGVVSEPWATIAINKAKQEGINLQITPIDLYSVYEAEAWDAGQLPIEGFLTLQEVLDDPDRAAALTTLENAYYQAIEYMLANPAESSELIVGQLTAYCDSRMDAKPIEETLSAGRLLYRPTPVGDILPDLDAYIEQMTGIEIDDSFYAQR